MSELNSGRGGGLEETESPLLKGQQTPSCTVRPSTEAVV